MTLPANRLIEKVREDYSEWLEIYIQDGKNPEEVVSLVLANKVLILEDKIKFLEMLRDTKKVIK